MSRRDTIIIAVLLNAGLLAILFMMAINTGDEKVADKPEANQIVMQSQEPTLIPLNLSGEPVAVQQPPLNPPQSQSNQLGAPATTQDELDNVLKDYAANVPPQTIVTDDDNPDLIEKDIPQEPSIENKAPENKPKPQEPSAPKAIAATPSADVKLVDVTVKKGDSLDKIARANGTTVDAIRKNNNLKNDNLKIGQVLKVPVGSKKAADAAKATVKKKDDAAQVAVSSEPEFYTIKSGDNPWKIAKQFKVKFEDLLKLNSLDEEKARNLKVGDRIRVK